MSFIYVLFGFIVGALFGAWSSTGFDISLMPSHAHLATTLEYGAGGAVVGALARWFFR